MLKAKNKAVQYEKELQKYASRLRDLFAEMSNDLRESEHLYRSIVDGAVDAIMTLDKKTVVQSWNRGAEEIFGYTEEEALGQKIEDLIIHEDVRESSDDLNQQVVSGKQVRNFEAVRYTKSGEERYVLISATPLFDDNGSFSAMSLIYKDVTEEHNAQARLLQSEKQATLGVIAGSIGHELNNLVSGMLVDAHLLKKRTDDDSELQKFTQRILTHLETVAMHGRNLLSLSKPTRPKMENVDVSKKLEKTTETLKLSGVLKHFTVESNYNSDLPIVIGDCNQIEQAIRNLEINAAHAMDAGGVLKVSTHLSEDGKFVEMKIEDNGEGIPEEIKEKIFQPFFTTKADGKGTGLGLPIVKQIVDSHKGYLKIDSEKGKGTCVTIGLPVAE